MCFGVVVWWWLVGLVGIIGLFIEDFVFGFFGEWYCDGVEW